MVISNQTFESGSFYRYEMLIAFWLVFVLTASISETSIQMADAEKKQSKAGNLLNTDTLESYACNNSLCYKYAAQEEIKKLAATQSNPIQLMNHTTDALKKRSLL